MKVAANNWQPIPPQRGYATRLLASDHREIARRQAREARIYEANGRRKPRTVRQ